jgi:hypothetical protein
LLYERVAVDFPIVAVPKPAAGPRVASPLAEQVPENRYFEAPNSGISRLMASTP